MEFSRQDYWSGLPFPSPEYLPDPGIKHWSPTLQADSLPSEPPGKPLWSKKPSLKMYMLYDPISSNSRKYRLSYSNRRQISGCLGKENGWGGVKKERLQRRDCKETCGGGRYFEPGDAFRVYAHLQTFPVVHFECVGFIRCHWCHSEAVNKLGTGL